MWPKFVKAGDLAIYTEAFGFTTNPAIILIMGATASSLMWNKEFCQKLAEAGFFVIRYDHRDTGKSSRVDYQTHPYTLKDLSADAIAILDAYELEKAHWVGTSMGSFIAQFNAIAVPQRLITLSCLMSSPKHTVFIDGFVGNDMSIHDLPASHPLMLKYYEEILSLESKNETKDNEMHRDIWKKISGEEHLIETRIFEGKVLKRLKSHKHIHNHSFALADSPPLFDKLNQISTPTLVIHGSDDYILPVEHGKQLAKIIPHAKFVEYKHMGHCLTVPVYQKLYTDLVDHFRKYQ